MKFLTGFTNNRQLDPYGDSLQQAYTAGYANQAGDDNSDSGGPSWLGGALNALPGTLSGVAQIIDAGNGGGLAQPTYNVTNNAQSTGYVAISPNNLIIGGIAVVVVVVLVVLLKK